MEHHGILRHFAGCAQVRHLRDGSYFFCCGSIFVGMGYLDHGALCHAVGQEVGGAVDEDRGFQGVGPVVVVCQTAHGGFDASNHHRHIGKEFFQDSGIDVGGIVGAESKCAAWGVGVVVTQAPCGGVVVDHGIHHSGGDSEKKSRCAELAEVAQVVAPVGLWYYSHPPTFGFEHSPYNGGAERGVVDIAIA